MVKKVLLMPTTSTEAHAIKLFQIYEMYEILRKNTTAILFLTSIYFRQRDAS